MRITALRTLTVVALVALAGCSGAVSQGDQATTTATPTTDAPTASQGYSVTVVSQTSGGSAGGVDFYVSDEENAIDDFAHLNVTIDRVGFRRASEGDDESDGGWVERDVDDRSVDLTRLKGANATRLTTVDAPNGSYDAVFAYVDSVNATLTSGERVRVKLPSEKLQIQKPFTVGDGESVDFVFDVAVHEAGKSGKYVLKPVVSQSGTDVPIESVDEDDEDEREGSLDVAFVGNVTRGANATLEVTRNGTAVENATVAVDDERVGTTDADGRVTVAIPDDEEVKIEVRNGDAETELELEFDDESADDSETEDEPESGDEEASEDEAETGDGEETEDEAETGTDGESGDDAEVTEDEETPEATETTDRTKSPSTDADS